MGSLNLVALRNSGKMAKIAKSIEAKEIRKANKTASKKAEIKTTALEAIKLSERNAAIQSIEIGFQKRLPVMVEKKDDGYHYSLFRFMEDLDGKIPANQIANYDSSRGRVDSIAFSSAEEIESILSEMFSDLQSTQWSPETAFYC